MKNKNQQGFTLIELLVVLAIIGILAAMILSNLATARKKARDSQRKTNIRSLASAIEMYADDNAYLFPEHTSETAITSMSGELTSNYIKELPSATAGDTYKYYYLSDTGGTDYVVYVKLESKTSTWFCASSGSSTEVSAKPTGVNDCTSGS